MKKILITGVNGYIGTSFKKWVSLHPELYSVDTISVRDDAWKGISFEKYDVIFHTAAIVHVKEDDISEYYRVNTKITHDLALKAKNDGVKQFIFLSTMGVYGREMGTLAEDTSPNPITPYAKSKLEAEIKLLEIRDDNFKVVILRPPIVYGKNCPGNYKRLSSLALKLPIFPEINNKRSMIYIDNLSEFIKILIDLNADGIFFPQNKEYVNTTNLVKLIAKTKGKQIITLRVFNWAVFLGVKFSGNFRKVFGSFVYEKNISGGQGTIINGRTINYEVISLEESIKRTES